MRRALAALFLTTVAIPAAAQCGEWATGFARPSTPASQTATSGGFGGDTTVNASGGRAHIVSFDAGDGPKLYNAVKDFQTTLPLQVRRWNGTTWDYVLDGPFGATNGNTCGPFACTDAGVPILVLGAGFSTPSLTRIVRWDGALWTAMPNAPVQGRIIATCDAGNGPTLVVAGTFANPVSGLVAVWNGLTWLQLGPTLLKSINALASCDDGSGPKLYVASDVGDVVTGSAVARWNGTAWEAVGVSPPVSQLITFNGELFAASTTLNKLVGGVWTPVAPATTGSVLALGIGDLGTGPRLAVASRTEVGLFDGTSYATVGTLASTGTSGGPMSIAFANDTGSTRLYVSGGFASVDGIACLGLASTDGTTWSTLGRGLDASVLDFARLDSAGSEQLFVAGNGVTAGYAPLVPTSPNGVAVTLRGVSRWDGTNWQSTHVPTTSSPGSIYTLRTIDLGIGPELYGGGAFVLGAATRGVARWSPAGWSAFAPDVGGPVYALGSFDYGFGAQLVVGGKFLSSAGDNVSRLVAGTWTPMSTGLNGDVGAFENFDEGSGPRLFAGGVFSGGIQRWSGTVWSSVGSGLNGHVVALHSFGGALWVAGPFTSASGIPVQGLARWNGVAWSNVPAGGANGPVYALGVHDDGRGAALYVGGVFSSIGGITAYSLARFDGTSWEPVAGGIDGTVTALASVDDDGDGVRDLMVGGRFHQTATVASSCFAKLRGCPHYTSFCFGDGTLADHTTPCPCGNDGAPGRGCASSFVADGALLEASGSTANDTLVLHVIDTPQSSLGIYLQHDAQDDRLFHDGVLCASGNLIRLRRHFSVGGESMFPDSTDTTTVAQRGSVTPGSGATRYYSCFYRNASTTFCPPATANVSNGIRVIW
jgi:hypothetical protein